MMRTLTIILKTTEVTKMMLTVYCFSATDLVCLPCNHFNITVDETNTHHTITVSNRYLLILIMPGKATHIHWKMMYYLNMQTG